MAKLLWVKYILDHHCKIDLLESSLELLGNSSVESGLLHDLADEPLLAVQVVVVELLVDILEHGDP